MKSYGPVLQFVTIYCLVNRGRFYQEIIKGEVQTCDSPFDAWHFSDSSNAKMLIKNNRKLLKGFKVVKVTEEIEKTYII